jgi:hypothetical protein
VSTTLPTLLVDLEDTEKTLKEHEATLAAQQKLENDQSLLSKQMVAAARAALQRADETRELAEEEKKKERYTKEHRLDLLIEQTAAKEAEKEALEKDFSVNQDAVIARLADLRAVSFDARREAAKYEEELFELIKRAEAAKRQAAEEVEEAASLQARYKRTQDEVETLKTEAQTLKEKLKEVAGKTRSAKEDCSFHQELLVEVKLCFYVLVMRQLRNIRLA